MPSEEDEDAAAVLREQMLAATYQIIRSSSFNEDRAAVVYSLQALEDYLDSINCNVIPLRFLCDAFSALDRGIMPGLFKTKVRPGPPSASPSRLKMQGHALAAVRMLRDLGVPLQKAQREVARVLDREGVRPLHGAGRVKGPMLKQWNEAANKKPELDRNRRMFLQWLRSQPEEALDQKVRKEDLLAFLVYVARLSRKKTELPAD